MKRQPTTRILALALALVLALGLPLSAQAAGGSPAVTYTLSGNSAALSLTGLSGHIYAAQLTLTLSGSIAKSELSFRAAAGQGEYTVTPAGNSTTITLYVYSDTPLNSGSTLSLGTLTGSKALALPSTGTLKLLDRGLAPIQGANGVQVSVAPGAPVVVKLPFTDISEGQWYYNAVQYAYTNNLMSGSGNRFDPEGKTNRAMIVTILYNLEGKPPVTSVSRFTDVPAREWYATPIAWATSNGVVSGYGSTFDPLGNITREQMATMLYNYAKYKGYDLSAANDLSGYSDAWKISSWAMTALRWANANKLVNGYSSTVLGPTNGASRAEAAAIFMAFCQNIVK